ncbi:unnamed protein product (macronuclear) [Paramecium tetraurelia]|uniref:Uncharacterized protein n=1 Tax=Paramecium tetraurelia TaxID=5888 RepID=A0C4W9_PARTE|nr:uncharacterized protein GSPATT00006335001 [Paramecium tetraurelia]CAK65836.1 unnamed protein product [Paramecium tetraurelia]|eukprot:XP_001433233.1 hypothetical protein (macronuclear) [Paramecium tetraurelia strain d4-2]
MQGLQTIYKFTYPKKQPLPEVHFICKREDENCFFYQLEASNYISLDVLLKAYLTQIIRLSIGQCLILIKLIYEKVIEVYRKEGKTLPKITLENIWIYTDNGFSGEIRPQKSMKIIFLNYQDENVSIEENLNQLQFINRKIKTICAKTEFKIRAIDGKNSHLIQQITNVIDDMFYDIEMCLYQSPKEIKDRIKKYVNEDTQETDYEYLQVDEVSYIQKNFENVIKKLNEIFKVDCQNELQLHRKLLTWQQTLFDEFIETTWDRQGYEIIMRILDNFEDKIKNDENMTTEIFHKFFRKLEEQGFLNFNSKKLLTSSEIKFNRELTLSLQNEKSNREKQEKDKDVLVGGIEQMFAERVLEEKEDANDFAQFKLKKPIRDKNLIILKDFYKQNAQNRYKLFDRFYYTINFEEKWTNYIKVEVLPREKKTIQVDDEQLDKTLTPLFEKLLRENKIGRNNQEEKPKYI